MQDKVKMIKIITVSMLVFIVLLSLALITNLVKLTKASMREKELTQELARLEAVYEQNEDEIETKQSKEYIIHYARMHLNMKLRGETAYEEEKE